MKKLIRRCPICNNEYGEVYKTIKMKLPQDVRLPDEYDVVTCENVVLLTQMWMLLKIHIIHIIRVIICIVQMQN